MTDSNGHDLGKFDDTLAVDNPLSLLELGQPPMESGDVSASALRECSDGVDGDGLRIQDAPGLDLSLPLEGLVETDEGVYEGPPEEDETGLVIVKIARFQGSPGQLASIRRLIRSAQAFRLAGPEDDGFEEEEDDGDDDIFRLEIERLDGEPSDVMPVSLRDLRDGVLHRALGVDEDAEPNVVPCPHSPGQEALEFEDEDGQVLAHVRVFEEDDEAVDEEDMDLISSALGADREDEALGQVESDDDEDDEDGLVPLDFEPADDFDDWL